MELTLAARLNPLSRAWHRLADQALALLGVSNSMGWCLVHLDRLGAEARQADLARAIGITEPSLVRTLHQLEAHGLVERRADPSDRRANNVALTDPGQALALKIEARLAELRSNLLEDVPSEDVEATLRVLDALNRKITERRLG